MDFIDLKTQQARIRPDIDRRMARVLDHGKYILGPEVDELEQRLASRAGTVHCISCASGTDALVMGLMALDARPGDVVFVPSFTFIATAEAVALVGAVPVFVDCRPDTYNICPQSLRRAIAAACGRGRPAGIIAVDLFGQPADYDEIERIAAEHSLWVMEDAAQSFGAAYHGRPVCSFGAVAATSFFPAKPLGCYGDGGAVFCRDDALAEKLRSIRVHGQGTDKYDNVRLGINGRLDTLQAAVLLAKLDIFDEEIELRNAVAQRYSAALAGRYSVPVLQSGSTSVWAQYSVQAEDRASCLAALKAENIPAAIYYPKPIHLQDAYRHYHQGGIDLPVCEAAAERIFSLPMHPYLSEADQARVIKALSV